jgi:hypothetical protein
MGVADVKIVVGIDRAPSGYKPGFVTVHRAADVQAATAPSPASWQLQNRSVAAADVYRNDNHMAAKLMLTAGRAKELAATFDSPAGLLSLRSNQPVRVDQLHEAAVVALALRQGGRGADADRLLSRANSTVGAVYRQHTIPVNLDADVAAIWAVQGRRDPALSMLERAMQRGWTHADSTDLADIEGEPAFQSLRGDPRFERIRAGLAAHMIRERAETENLHI